MKIPLKKALKQRFEDVELSPEQLQLLQQTQNTLTASPRPIQKLKFAWPTLAASTAALLILLYWPSIAPPKDITKDIAKEVAHNHFKLKPLEIKSNSLHTVSQYFTKLDFQPISSIQISKDQFQLIGGRYCSLKGITAAQFRYKEIAEGPLETVYEVPYDATLYGDIPNIDKGEAPLSVHHNGLLVKIWVEKGLLIAMTDSEKK